MIFIVVKQPVRAKYADDFPSLVEEFTRSTRAEPGNISYDWYRSADDPNLWVLIEAYRDRESGDAHVQSAHFKAAMEQMPRLAGGRTGDHPRRGSRRQLECRERGRLTGPVQPVIQQILISYSTVRVPSDCPLPHRHRHPRSRRYR